MKEVRKPAVAGMFYPASVEELENQLQLMFDVSKPEKEFGNVRGLISPHAGYVYSGKTAAYAYNTIKGKHYDTVVVISPSHREYFYGTSVYKGDAYSTPLGEIEVNKPMAEKIVSNGQFITFGFEGHRSEHALEVQLPFLQKALDNFKLVPIVMGDQSKELINDLAESLAKSIEDSTLIVASSDLSHFHSKEIAWKLDSRVLERVGNFDYESLLNDIETGASEACGGGPIAAMMKTFDLLGIRNVEVLAHSDSGDVTGDNSEVVGYMSAVVYE
jgi:AmmeMemoRadiSam system protein B